MSHEWREHPHLKALFHPDYPDDLQVIAHEGGPRLSENPPELVWVTVIGINDNVFVGRLLNRPVGLEYLQFTGWLFFLMPEQGSQHPILVTKKYLNERPDWIIEPCQKCGLSELFDAPSDLIKVIFPHMPEGSVLESFTSFCPLCGGGRWFSIKILCKGTEIIFV